MTHKWEGDKVEEAVRAAVGKVVFRRTERVREIAVRSILSGQKSGRIYNRGGRIHQASAPGEPPANDTGRLAQSGKTSYEKESLIGRVTFTTAYAEPLEYGTERMEPRPYLRPALAEGTEGMQEELAETIKDAMK